jgi:hypothetical protein
VWVVARLLSAPASRSGLPAGRRGPSHVRPRQSWYRRILGRPA